MNRASEPTRPNFADPIGPRTGWCLFGLAAAASAVLLLHLQRNFTFVADEVVWIEWAGTDSVGSLFAPYNGNLHVAALLGTRALLDIFGADSYLPFQLFGLAGVWLCAGALYSYSARRVGNLLGLAPPVAILFLGTGWAILLQPLVGSVLVFSLGLGTCALLALERRDRRGDIGALLLLCGSLSFYSVGVAFLAGAGVAILLAPRWRGRAWVVLVPGLLYAAWRLTSHLIDRPFYVSEVGGQAANLLRAPLYFIDSGALVIGALFAGSKDGLGTGPATGLYLYGFSWGRLAGALVLLVLELGLISAVVLWLRRRAPIRTGVWVAVVMLAALWTTQAYVLGAGRTAGESRYLFAGAFLLLILIVEVAAPPSPKLPAWAFGLVGLVLAVSVVLNVHAMRPPYLLLRDYSVRARADMASVQLARERVNAAFLPQESSAFVPPALYLTAGGWNEMTDAYGSPAYTPAEVAAQVPGVRREADSVLAAAFAITTTPSPAPAVGCGPARPTPQKLPPGGAVLVSTGPAVLEAGRFASPSVAVGALFPGRPVRLRVPRDAASAPWSVAPNPGVGLKVCALP